MPALLVAPLLAYQEQTGDPRVDEIFVRLDPLPARHRHVVLPGDILHDTFLQAVRALPTAADGENRGTSSPLYGAGVNVDGSRADFGEYDD